jgi:alkanesulfonate monooxygenase SsuD/methylene tetrahydromethanopterin reductase-like flavin-dependent oxidoreductase (luciferase family)
MVLPNVPWPEFLRRCRQVEALGFDAIGFADHLVDWTGGKGPWFELWTQLAAVAMATSRVRLTALVAQIPLRNPVQMAHQALSADHISGGRLDLGFGTGLPSDPSCRMMGVETWTAQERVARFSEYVGLVTRLLTGEELTNRGRHYADGAALLGQTQSQSPRIPIVVAAMGPGMLRHAARHADIWNSLSSAKTFAEQVEETRQRIVRIDAACAVLGRDPSTLRRSYLMFDPAARAGGGKLAYYESVAAFTDMVRTVIGLGITDIGLYYPAIEAQWPAFERIAQDAIPALRRVGVHARPSPSP